MGWTGSLQRAADGNGYVWQLADDTGLPITGTAEVVEDGGKKWFRLTGAVGFWPHLRFPALDDDPARDDRAAGEE